MTPPNRWVSQSASRTSSTESAAFEDGPEYWEQCFGGIEAEKLSSIISYELCCVWGRHYLKLLGFI